MYAVGVLLYFMFVYVAMNMDSIYLHMKFITY